MRTVSKPMPPIFNAASSLFLKILDWGCAAQGTEWCSHVPCPPYARLYFILGGDAYYQCPGDKKHFSLRAGMCYLLPTGFSFHYACNTGMEQLFFHITLMQENSQDVFRFLPQPLSMPFETAVAERLKENMKTQSPAAQLRVHSILESVLANLLEINHTVLPQTQYSPCVSRTLRYLHTHPSIDVSLEQLAKRSFTSQTTLSKYFRSETGTTVGRYLDDIVFAQAELLLRNKQLSIAAVSEQLGFANQFYFSRRFRQRYGCSPQTYRTQSII